MPQNVAEDGDVAREGAVDRVEVRARRDLEAGRHGAGEREPAPARPEPVDEHQADPEDRHRDAHEGAEHRPVLDGRAPPQRSEDPGGKADEEGDEERGDRELDRGREVLRELAPDVAAGADRTAEVPLREAAEELDVLDGQRPVEPERLAHLLDLRGARLLAGERHRGIARDEPQREEHDRDHAQQHREHVRNAPQDVTAHVLAARAATHPLSSR